MKSAIFNWRALWLRSWAYMYKNRTGAVNGWPATASCKLKYCGEVTDDRSFQVKDLLMVAGSLLHPPHKCRALFLLMRRMSAGGELVIIILIRGAHFAFNPERRVGLWQDRQQQHRMMDKRWRWDPNLLIFQLNRFSSWKGSIKFSKSSVAAIMDGGEGRTRAHGFVVNWQWHYRLSGWKQPTGEWWI